MSNDFDVFLKFEKKKAEHGNEPANIADYPDNVVGTLRVFNKVWCPPALAIPSKRQKSKFNQWVKDLQTLEDLCGDNARFEIALRMALAVYENYSREYQFIVDTPLKLKNLIITALSQMNRAKQEESIPEPVVVKSTDKAKTKKMLGDLRDSLTEGK